MSRSIRRLRAEYEIAAREVQIALMFAISAESKAGFRQDQSRGPDGRWDGGNGGLAVVRKDKTGDPKTDATTDLLLDLAGEAVRKIGPGSGPLYGMKIHAEMARLIRSLDIPGIGAHGVEQSFSGGDLVRYGLNGSVSTDVILRDGRTVSAPIRAVWDIKTGSARLSSDRAKEIRIHLGVGEEVPIIEIHIERGVGIKSYLYSSRA